MPEQVSNEWEKFILPINELLPPAFQSNHSNMAKVLASIMREDLIIWAYYKEERMIGIVLTTMREDIVLNIQYLFIYGIYSSEPLNMEIFKDGMKTLEKFARANGCSGIQALTTKRGIVETWKSYGGTASMVLIEKGV